MFAIKILKDLEGLCFYQSYKLYPEQEYLAERVAIDRLKVFGEQFAGGHVVVRCREGRDYIQKVGK